jgi:hypothetical protein
MEIVHIVYRFLQVDCDMAQYASFILKEPVFLRGRCSDGSDRQGTDLTKWRRQTWADF